MMTFWVGGMLLIFLKVCLIMLDEMNKKVKKMFSKIDFEDEKKHK